MRTSEWWWCSGVSESVVVHWSSEYIWRLPECSLPGLKEQEPAERTCEKICNKSYRRGVGVSTFVLARRIDRYALWPISVTTWPWPDLTWGQTWPWTWPFKVILYMVRRALTRQSRRYKNRCSTFQIKYFIVLDFTLSGFFFKFDPWWPQFWPEPKKWPKWFRNDFSRAFERRFWFFSTTTRSGDHGGGGGGRSNVETPPPPSRARVNRKYKKYSKPI